MSSLTESDRSSLLRLARLAIAEAVARDQLLADIPTDGVFSERRGVFVSLHVGKRLRGCVGVVEPEHALGETVVRCAASAALHDRRFRAVRSEELPGLQVEISLLSTPCPIGIDEIQIGRHGLLICRGEQRGLLLPQVAVTHEFSVEQFLTEACGKAELPPDAWREAETQVFGFTCESFGSEPAAES